MEIQVLVSQGLGFVESWSFDELSHFSTDCVFFHFFLENGFNFVQLYCGVRSILLDPDEDLPDIDFLSSASEKSNVLGSFVSSLVVENVENILLDAWNEFEKVGVD